MEQVLHLTEQAVAVAALRVSRDQLRLIGVDPYRWLWVVNVLHNAVQAYMVLALVGTAWINVARERDRRRYFTAFQRGDPRPTWDECRLEDFLDLYQGTKMPERMARSTNSRVFVAEGTQDQSIAELHERRNPFTHYKPILWTEDLTEYPRITADCLAIISFLALESNNVFWHGYEDLERETAELIREMQSLLHTVAASYGATLPPMRPPIAPSTE